MEALIRRHLNYLKTVSLDFVRDIMGRVNWGDRLIAIRGQRGVGKTTLMLQRILQEFGPANTSDVLYVSLDNLYFVNHGLLDFIEAFYRRGGKYLFLDEVHKYAGWSREVKNAYDEFPELHIVLTGSSMINILDGEADLSRRCISYDMQGLSFREYLEMFHGHRLPVCCLEDMLTHGSEVCVDINSRIRPLRYFDEYLQRGYYPFLKEGEGSYYTRIENIVSMIIESELPQLRSLDVGNVRKIKSLLEILASGMPMVVDTVKLSKMAGVARTTLLQYLQHLDAAKIIRLLYSDYNNVKRMQKPDKVYVENTSMLYALSSVSVNRGTLREVFFANQLAYGHRLEYSNTSADFTVDSRYTFEVGGRSKDGRQIAGVKDSYIASDDEDYAIGNKIPLWLFGFLY